MSAATVRTSDAARAESRFREEMLTQQRDWIAFLEYQRDLLELAASATPEPEAHFEIAATTPEARRAALERAIATIAVPRRALFRRVLDQERVSRQHELDALQQPGRVADPDEAMRIAIADLLDQATGRTTEDGRGLVPYGTPDAVRWYSVDTSALSRVPDAATYGLAGGPHRRGPWASLGLALAMFGILAGLLLIRTPAAASLPPVASGPAVNNRLANPWAVAEVIVLDRAGEPTTLPVAAASISRASEPSQRAAVASLGPLDQYPHLLCLPLADLAPLQTIIFPAAHEVPTRTFRLADEPTGDLLVTTCPGSGGSGQTRRATLREIAPLPSAVPGEPVMLTDSQPITLTAATLIGPGQDPSIPAGAVRLEVTVAHGPELDWLAYRPTLLTLTGEPDPTTEQVPGPGVTTFRYRLTAAAAVPEVIWQVTPPRGPLLRYRLALSPPPTRDQVLQRDLQAQVVNAVADPMAGQITLHIRLTNTGTLPIQLTADDIELTAGAQRIPLPDPTPLTEPLAPGESRLIPFQTAVAPTQATLRVGRVLFTLRRDR